LNHTGNSDMFPAEAYVAQKHKGQEGSKHFGCGA
jgi:hypothetical protein